MENNEKWLEWAVELQALAQAGLTYGKDVYDRERYQRIRDISAEIMAHMTDMPFEKVKGLFCNESGYQTPKIDTRAAIFKDGDAYKIDHSLCVGCGLCQQMCAFGAIEKA